MPSILSIKSPFLASRKAGKQVYSFSIPKRQTQVLNVNREKHNFFIMTSMSKLSQVHIIYMHNSEIGKRSVGRKSTVYLTSNIVPITECVFMNIE